MATNYIITRELGSALADGNLALDRALDRVLIRLLGEDRRALAQAPIMAQRLGRTLDPALERNQIRAALFMMALVIRARQARDWEARVFVPQAYGALALNTLALHARATDQSSNFVAATSLARPNLTDPLLAAIANAEWAFLSLDCSDDQFKVIAGRLEQMTQAEDDWTRLLSLSALLMLGKGDADKCAIRNGLLDKGIKRSNDFTFPKNLRVETDTPAFRKELPEVLFLAFLHDPDDPWLRPESFDPRNPESRFFLSSPRDFFALAAEALAHEKQSPRK